MTDVEVKMNESIVTKAQRQAQRRIESGIEKVRWLRRKQKSKEGTRKS